MSGQKLASQSVNESSQNRTDRTSILLSDDDEIISESDQSEPEPEPNSAGTLKKLKRRSQLPVRQETDDEDEELNGSQVEWPTQESNEMSPVIGRSIPLSDKGIFSNFVADLGSSSEDEPQKRRSRPHQRRIIEESASDASDTAEDATMDSEFASD